MIIFANMKDTIIEADNIPAPFLKITKGRIKFVPLIISAKGLIIITKNKLKCETINRLFVKFSEINSGVKLIIIGNIIKSNTDTFINIVCVI